MTYGHVVEIYRFVVSILVRLHIAVGGALRLEFYVYPQQDITNLNHRAHYDDR
jgi:hypothetical protein